MLRRTPFWARGSKSRQNVTDASRAIPFLIPRLVLCLCVYTHSTHTLTHIRDAVAVEALTADI